MAKRSGPRDPGEPIPAELVRGKEQPDIEDEPEPIEPAVPPPTRRPPAQHASAAEKRTPTGRSDRRFLAGLIAVVLVGGGLYIFRGDIATQYELRAHPERYWAGEVADWQLALKLSQLNEQDCLVDLLAARMKEPISAARGELLGLSSSEARRSAVAATAGYQQACSAFADFVKRDRERLAAAERELEEAQEDHRIAAGLIPRHSPSFASAWQTASPSWAEIVANPKYQALDEAGRESVRGSYWNDVLMPLIPTDELRRAVRDFDQLTAGKRSR